MVYSQCTGPGMGIGTGNGSETRRFCNDVEMFTLVQDRNRDQDQLFPIVPVPFLCGLNKP